MTHTLFDALGPGAVPLATKLPPRREPFFDPPLLAAAPEPEELGQGMQRRRLPVPRLVQQRRDKRPALLLGWITDRHGRRLFAEIVPHTSFVRPDEIEEPDDVS